MGIVPRRLPRGRIPRSRRRTSRRIIARVRGIEGDVLAFSSGHMIRMIAARWLGLPPGAGRFSTAELRVWGCWFEHRTRDEPIISLWNQVAQPRE